MYTKKVLSKIIIIPIFILLIFFFIFEYENNKVLNSLVDNFEIQTKNEIIKDYFFSRIEKNINNIDNLITNEYNQLEKNAQIEIKNRIEVALEIIDVNYIANKDSLSRNEIIQNIIKRLEKIEFRNKNDYFYIFEIDTKKLIYHPIKEIVNTDFSIYKDSMGNNLYDSHMSSIDEKDFTYLNLEFYKPNDTSENKQLFSKINGISKYEPLNIVIGTGVYLDELKLHSKENILKQLEIINRNHGKEYFFIYEIDKNNLNQILGFNKKESSLLVKLEEILPQLISNSEPKTLEYTFFNSQTNNDEIKYSYLQYFKNLNWLVGSGFEENMTYDYMRDFIDLISKTKDKFLLDHILFMLILLTILIFLTYYFMNRYNNIISKHIDNIKNLLSTIRKEKQKYKFLLNFSSDGIHIIDKDGNLIEYSKSFEKMLGYSRNEIKDFNIRDIDPNLSKDKLEIKNENVTLTYEDLIKKPSTFLTKHKKKDGSIIDVEITAKAIKYDNKPYLYASSRDISLQLIVEKNNKLKSLAELINNIAHQWRQPLNVISLCSDSIRLKGETFNNLTIGDLIDLTDEIKKQVQYLSTTIDSFDTYISDESTNSKISLKETISKALNLIENIFSSESIYFIVNLEDDLEIYSNQSQLIQAFINIFNNSKDALLNKKERFIFIDTRRNEDYYEIIIKDNGGGIDSSIINKVFEPYSTTKHQSLGKGIGMSIVYKVFHELCNSEIFLDNETYTYNNITYTGAKIQIKFKINK